MKTELRQISWNKYQSTGTKYSIGFYIRMVYGILGFVFLISIHLSAFIIPTDLLPKQKTPPAVFYWKWLAESEADQTIITNEDPFLLDEDKLEVGVLWGIDRKGRSILHYMGKGAGNYLQMGLLAGMISILGGIAWSTPLEWIKRPKLPLPYNPAKWRIALSSSMQYVLWVIDSIPKFFLLLAIYAFGRFSVLQFSIGMGILMMFGSASLFKGRLSSFLKSEQYIYALEVGQGKTTLFLKHFLVREAFFLILIQIPLSICSFILYEATLSYLNWGIAEMSSWGNLAMNNMLYYDWSFYIPFLSILFVVSSLYTLGETLTEGLINRQC
jgi:ABC-type dipeptide/oligopeptide/nickel transport system permease subunit